MKTIINPLDPCPALMKHWTQNMLWVFKSTEGSIAYEKLGNSKRWKIRLMNSNNSILNDVKSNVTAELIRIKTKDKLNYTNTTSCLLGETFCMTDTYAEDEMENPKFNTEDSLWMDEYIPNPDYCEICDDACSQPAKAALSGMVAFWLFKTALLKHLIIKHKAMCKRKGYNIAHHLNMTESEAEKILEQGPLVDV